MITPFEIFLSTLPSQEFAHHPDQLQHKPETTQELPPLNPYKKSLLSGSRCDHQGKRLSLGLIPIAATKLGLISNDSRRKGRPLICRK